MCKLPQIELTNVVFARRPLKRAETEMLRLQDAVRYSLEFSMMVIRSKK